MADPYGFLKEERPKQIKSVTELFPSAEDWAKPERAAEPPPEETLASGNTFGQNVAIGGVEAAKELAMGAELWGRKLGGDPNVQRDIEAEKQRRQMYAPVKDTWGGMLGSVIPAAAVGALTPPSGLASYAANAALQMAPTLNTQDAVKEGALSVPGTLIGNLLAKAGAKGSNAVLGRSDPYFDNVIAGDKTLRAAGDKGLPITSFVKPAERAMAYDTAIIQNHPAAVLDRLRNAADAKNTTLWTNVDTIAANNGTPVVINPANTATALAEVLSVAQKPMLTNTVGVNPAKVADLIGQLQGAKSFTEMRDVQQAIGQAIGQLSANPNADRQMLAALKKSYVSVLTDMESTGNATLDKQLKEALAAASKQHREEVLPFRTGEINGAKNPILRNYVNGVYTNDPSRILQDLNTTSSRAGFGNFVYPKLQPEEAAIVQKIIAEPKLTREIRQGVPTEGGFHPVERIGKMFADADMVRYSPTLKRILAASPSLTENTPMRPVSRAAIGALRQAMSGNRAAAGIQAGSGLASEAISPLTSLFGEKHPTYVQGYNQP